MKAKIYEASIWLHNTEPEVLKFGVQELLKDAGFNILQYTEHHFKPQGFTALWLLGESHCAVHTFPEAERTYLQLSSCNKAFFDNFMRGAFCSLNIIKITFNYV